MFNLKGRKALVTGAGQGMGLGIAKALAENGAQVFINDLHPERAGSAASQIINCKALPGDITEGPVRAGFKKTTGAIDILVHNAGVPEGMAKNIKQAQDLSDHDYNTQLALNYHAMRALCDIFVPSMRENGHGRVLIISSEAHRLGVPMGLTHYASAKAAALGYMRPLAAEVGRDGVTVNALSLGTMNNFEGSDRAAASTLIGRPGSPEDVGAAALYLCSDEAGWMTGQTISLNGGASTA